MHEGLLDLLRCPFCGTRLQLDDSAALRRSGASVDAGVLGCECCAYPIVAGIPVMIADDPTRDAMHALEAGRGEEALLSLLGLDTDRAKAFQALRARTPRASYREMMDVLSPDPEGTYFVYRFSDPTYVAVEGLLQALNQHPTVMSGRLLDLCGGSGHLTRVMSRLRPSPEPVVLADVYFWKLWLATQYTAPDCAPVCCDGNNPLPFAREAFSLVFLLDAFPYVWQRRMLAEEMMRLVAPGGAAVLPHLHNALGENFAAGMALTPGAYEDLFAPMQPRLFSDDRLFTEAVERRTVDLSASQSAADLGAEPSITLIATERADLYRPYAIQDAQDVTGELRINPLYRVERQGDCTTLTLAFPTVDYEEEFGACKQYLPATLTVKADLTGALTPATLGPYYGELRRRRVLLDLPAHYV